MRCRDSYKAELPVPQIPSSWSLPYPAQTHFRSFIFTPTTMFFQTTFISLVLASLATAGPTVLPRDDDLVTFCQADGSCFQASAAIDAGCVDLPLFSENFTTASLSAPGVECLLSANRECSDNRLPAILLNSAGTADLSDLGLSTVGSFLCTSDVDLINLCTAADANLGCFQASTVTNGCANLPRISQSFVSAALTTGDTECTVFEDADCAGASAVVTEPSVTVEVGPLGLSTIGSVSCVNNEMDSYVSDF
ncbi:hypothetical protein C8R43DRAFT_1024136 [Mycena crocata]|nr:hypothetical protein C8R43DRAFT_1024136 [Mycena crocata]